MKTIAFLNNKGGVGKTSLLFHVAQALAAKGRPSLMIDLDPQANLTSFYTPDDELEQIWDSSGDTIYSAMKPLLDGDGGVRIPRAISVASNLGAIVGDLRLSEVEDELSAQWPRCLNGELRAFRVTTAFAKMIAHAMPKAEFAFVDLGPNLGAINRCALIAADYVIVPMGADLFSIRGLRNLGPKLNNWRADWKDRLDRAPDGLDLSERPAGKMMPLGYSINVFNVYRDEPAQAYQRWIDEAPAAFAHAFRARKLAADDCLAKIKNYGALMPYAQRARKPIFALKYADGPRGAQLTDARACGDDMIEFASNIERKIAALA